MGADMLKLGQRAMALPGWRVLSPMVWTGENGLPMGPDWQPVPDMASPTTLGAILALAGWPSTNMGQRPWVWGRVDGVRYDGVGDTLAEALVAYAEAVGRWPGGGK